MALLLAALAVMALSPAVRADYPIADERLTSGATFRSQPLISDGGERIVYNEWTYRTPGVIAGTVQGRLIDRPTMTDRLIAHLLDGTPSPGTLATAISGNGERIALLSYRRLTDDAPDPAEPYAGIYVYDVASDLTTFVAVADETMPRGIASLSADGGLGAGVGSNYLPLIIDLSTGATASIPDAHLTTLITAPPLVSADGTTVVFTATDSPELDPRDTNGVADVYAYDVATGEATLVSVTRDGSAGDGDSFDARPSADGEVVAFASAASGLTLTPSCVPVNPPGDLSCVVQIYVRDLSRGSADLASASTAGVPGEVGTRDPLISGDGRYVVFSTASSVIDPTNELPSASSGSLHVRDREHMTTLPLLSAVQKAMPFLDIREYALAGNGRMVAYTASTITNRYSYDVYLTGNPSHL